MSEIDFDAEPDASDPISQILSGQPPVRYYGRYWSDQVQSGHRALAGLARDRYREVRFEDLVARPGEVLREICDFFELDAERGDWLDCAAALVRGTPPRRFPNLAADEQARLAAACAPGRALLGQK